MPLEIVALPALIFLVLGFMSGLKEYKENHR